MIKSESLSAEWISVRRKKYSKDPAIMEAMIYALYLLEHLKLAGLEFIFKGGTSLVLLMDLPKRFSVDIDIILDPSINKEKLEGYLSKIVPSSAFNGIELDAKRSYQTGIPKAHYKFLYESNFRTRDKQGNVISNPKREILLDIMFLENPYPVTVKRPIDTEWVLQEGNVIKTIMPDIDSIIGDKLTAFAPNTTGVPYGIEKEKEIMKQLFDIG
ncbi:MAG: nucleotidyl transferase AbiEii/AbiGii toxin family protein, partial [Bacteroidota bacterium]|nr:nucleotidyl transferase AbiEii/AbiGii toxin family protein [Bacteroidota bacterium]